LAFLRELIGLLSCMSQFCGPHANSSSTTINVDSLRNYGLDYSL
jgi:hypothetical protein